jgi:hypothetical protein
LLHLGEKGEQFFCLVWPVRNTFVALRALPHNHLRYPLTLIELFDRDCPDGSIAIAAHEMCSGDDITEIEEVLPIFAVFVFIVHVVLLFLPVLVSDHFQTFRRQCCAPRLLNADAKCTPARRADEFARL